MNSKYTCLLLVLICTRLPTSSGKAFFEKLIDNPQNERPARHIQTGGKIELVNKENDSTVDSRLKNSSQNETLCLAQNKILVSGKCYSLFETAPCGKGEWLVIDNSIQEVENRNVICKTKPCTKISEVWWPALSKCISKFEARSKFCSTGEIVKTNVYGEAMCTCSDNFGKIQNDDKCYEYYQKGPCEHNEVVTYDKKTGNAICSIDKCFQENTESFKKSFTEQDLHSEHRYDLDETQRKNTDENDTNNSKRKIAKKQTTVRKEKSYAPLHGDGPCHKLGSASICNDYGEHSRYVVNQISHIPECSNSNLQLNIINSQLTCNVDPKTRECASSVLLQKNSRNSPW